MLELRLEDLISIEECDPVVDDDTWPSHMAIGGLLCPTTESLRPFADLRGLQGFFLGKDLREHASEQFHASATYHTPGARREITEVETRRSGRRSGRARGGNSRPKHRKSPPDGAYSHHPATEKHKHHNNDRGEAP